MRQCAQCGYEFTPEEMDATDKCAYCISEIGEQLTPAQYIKEYETA